MAGRFPTPEEIEEIAKIEDEGEAKERFRALMDSYKRDTRIRRTRARAVVRGRALKQEATRDGVTVCEACGWSVPEKIGSRAMHLHHVREVAYGGTNLRSNLVVICPNCHVIAHALADRLGSNAPSNRDELLTALKDDPLSVLRGRPRH